MNNFEDQGLRNAARLEEVRDVVDDKLFEDAHELDVDVGDELYGLFIGLGQKLVDGVFKNDSGLLDSGDGVFGVRLQNIGHLHDQFEYAQIFWADFVHLA